MESDLGDFRVMNFISEIDKMKIFVDMISQITSSAETNFSNLALVTKLKTIFLKSIEEETDLANILLEALSDIRKTINDEYGSYKHKLTNKVEDSQIIMSNILSISDSINSKTANLVEITDKISQLIDTVEIVTQQTNLLAINASIEASHAGGDIGNSFSVVATQVKTLSQKTNSSIIGVRDVVKTMHQDTAELIETAKSLNNLNKDYTSTVDLSLKILSKLLYLLKKIDDSIAEFQSVKEKKEKILFDLESNIKISAKNLKELFFSLNTYIEKAFLDTTDVNSILLAKKDHFAWKMNLIGMFLGIGKLEVFELKDHNSCRLGKWRNSKGKEKFLKAILDSNLDKFHAKVHHSGRKCVEYFNEGELEKAMDEYNTNMVSASEETQKALDNILEIVKEAVLVEIKEGLFNAPTKKNYIENFKSFFKKVLKKRDDSNNSKDLTKEAIKIK